MRKNFLFLCLFKILFDLSSIESSKFKPLKPSENYTHNLIIDEDDPDQYVLLWKLLDNSEIQFEVHVRTNGWVGVGFSPNGGMPSSDIVIGWAKGNEVFLKV
jgi:hypothetical protein